LSVNPQTTAASNDVLVAVRNTVKLGLSLLATWGIGLGIRLLLPRFLGETAFGQMRPAEEFTAMLFFAVQLGVDTYIRKELPVRPDHAKEFFGTIFVLRALVAILLFAIVAVMLELTHRPPEVKILYWLFAVGNLFHQTKEMLGAMLHARQTVDGLSLSNVVGKFIWGGGVVASLWWGRWLPGIALSFAVAKCIECLWLWALVQKHFQLTMFTASWTAAKVVVLSALPFYLNTVSHTVYNKLDTWLVSVLITDAEAGWYGAASQLAGIAMLVAPIIGWVAMPLLSRALSRGREEYERLRCRILELVLIIAIPTSLAIGLGADVWLAIISGPRFAEASLALRILSPLFVLIYVSIISAISLILEGRAWTVTLISFTGMIINPLLNLVVISRALEYFGPGGAGAGAAMVQFLTETTVSVVMFAIIGKKAFDRRTLNMVLRTTLVVAGVVALDRFLFQRTGLPGIVRILIDGAAYAGGVVLIRAVDVKETYQFAKAAFRKQEV
jgi:O-antigen/teichoic acid export membrane protein